MQINANSSCQMASSHFLHRQKKLLGPNPDPAWAQSRATIRAAERCRSTAGMHIHVETLKSFWAVYPCRGHLEGAEPITAAHGRRQGPPPGEAPTHRRASCELLGSGKLTQGYLSSAVKVFGPPATRALSKYLSALGLEPTTLHFTVQPPTEWATITPDFGVQKWRKTLTWLQNYSGCLFPVVSSYYGNHGTNGSSVKPGLYSSLSPSALCKSMWRQGV